VGGAPNKSTKKRPFTKNNAEYPVDFAFFVLDRPEIPAIIQEKL